MVFFVAHTLPQFAYIRRLFALRTASEARPPCRADSQKNRSPGDFGNRLHILIRMAQMVLEPDDVAELTREFAALETPERFQTAVAR
jgi:hypothetical protein